MNTAVVWEGHLAARQKQRWALAKVTTPLVCTVFFGSTVVLAATADEEKSNAKSSLIAEVLVTAQKRTERLQDVPISISVVRGDDLDKSSDSGIADVLNRVPGVLLQSGNGLNKIVIRGVTAVNSRTTGGSPIAFYLDSVPFGFVRSAIIPDANPYDLDRIEVLRGPQGTLYGSSTLNGVVRVLTKDADVDRFDFKARTSASSTEDGGENYRGDIALNVPIIEGKLAARAVAGYEDLGGWIDRPNRNEKDANDGWMRNLRLKVKAQPISGLSIDSLVWLSRSISDNPPYSVDGSTNNSLQNEPGRVDYDVYGLRAVYDFADFTISSSSSYIDFLANNYQDFFQSGFFPSGPVLLNSRLKNHLFAEEVVLTSTHAGPWRWSLGGMYRDATDRSFFLRPGYTAPIDASDFSESWAVFGELSRQFFDGRLELTGGLRYFEDKVSQYEYSRSSCLPAACNPSLGPDPGEKFDKLSPRVLLTWHPSNQFNVYASYSEGFRSGLLQAQNVVQLAPQIPDASPDTLKNWEVGAKGALWEGRLSFDAAIYYMDWEGVQQQVTLAPTFFLAAVNAGSASGEGFDFGLTIRPLEGLEFGANFSWNGLEFDENVLAPAFPGFQATSPILFPEGARPSSTPEYTYGASASYAFALGDGGYEGQLSTSFNYVSEKTSTFLSGSTVMRTSTESLLIGRAGFSINSPAHWEALLFVDNLTNEDGIVTGSSIVQWRERVRPRTLGLQVGYSFR